MEKILDALLGRTFKASKFLHVVSLAMTHIASKKDHHRARCSQDLSAVVLLLKHDYHKRALLRVERIINDLSMLDALNMIEGYLNLLIERVDLIEKERVCPDVLKESIATLFYAAYEILDFPELQHICCILIARFGREFASRAIELRVNCGVNPMMIIQLSTRQPTLECRMKVLNDIAVDNNITLQLENVVSIEENLDENKKQNQPGDGWEILREKIKNGDIFTRISRDVAQAPEVAFEPATFARLTNMRKRPISVGTREVGVQ